MTLTYTVSLTIDGLGTVDIGDQLNSLTVQSGSSDGFEQPSPSTCFLSFIGSPMTGSLNMTPNWWLGRYVGVAVTPSDGSKKPVFAGTVFSVNASPVNADCSTMIVDLQLQSPAADLSNYIVTNDRIAENEADRIVGWFQDAEDISWLEVATNVSWDEVQETKTWAQYIQNKLSQPTISIFGFDRALLPYTADESRLDDVIQSYVLNNGGWLGEILTLSLDETFINSNTIFYDPDTFTSTSGFDLDLTTCALFSGLSIQGNLYNLYNYVQADNGIEIRSYEVQSSIDNHGFRDIELVSSLSATNDLDTLVTQKAIGRAEPIAALSQVTIDYDLMSPEYMRIWFGGEPVLRNFTGVPAVFGGNQKYWILGMTLDLSYEHAEATWTVLPQSTVAYFDTWWSLNYTDTWNTYATALTKWQDLT